MLAALNDPNPDVQYAAAVAVLQAHPDRRFRGSQRVASGPRFGDEFAFCRRRRFQLRQRGGNEMAGLFTRIDFETVTAFTGREGFEISPPIGHVGPRAGSRQCGLRWPLSQTVSNLRADARTAADSHCDLRPGIGAGSTWWVS